MKILVKENPRTIALVSSESALLFRHITTENNLKRCLIEFLSKQDVNLREYKRLSDREIDGFLGLIEVNDEYYICTITGSRQVAAPIPNESINKIHNVDFYSIDKPTWDFLEIGPNGFPIVADQDEDDSGNYQKHPCHELKKLLSTGGFYFSNDFDLTSSLQSRGTGDHSLSFDRYKEEYMWNSFMMEQMVSFRNNLDANVKEKLDDEGFLTTVIRGFAETFHYHLQRERIAMTVISRQSWKRAGTRFNSRGIDDDSYVANFVETEYILYSNTMCYSYTQIRGSVPVFWEQDTALINPKVQITRSEEATQPVFDQHFNRLLESYNSVNIVNLLSTKSSEIQLSKRYKSHLNTYLNNGGSNVYLTEFDFHKETSDQGYSSSTKIYNLIKESLYEFGYFSYDVQNSKVLSEQTGVFRTNCLDCLDRTNLIQQFISTFALSIFLKDHDHYVPQDSEFFNKHNSLWADNGDQISQIYTGTNALKSSFSRKGKMSFAGALSDATKSVSRMYINNFVDKGKQVTIDTLLGRLAGQNPVLLYDPISDYVNEKIKQVKDQFTTSDNIDIFTGTYNVNGMNKVEDLSEWLYPIGDKFTPDVVVLGFQEVIELSAGSILNADYSKSSFWTNEVSKCLNQYGKYIMLRAEQMSSLLLLFFVKAQSVNFVKQVEGAIKKTGLGGMTGNKGAVAIRFNYGASSFCFVNAHLAAGTNNVQERNNDYHSIANGIKFSRGSTINDNDTVFWIGDLNYRISLSNEEVRRAITNGDLDYLIQNDQLTIEIKKLNAFKGFAEPSVSFNPTYKYDKGTNRYDSSEKQRTPSWTDRIIYKGSHTKPLAYSSADSLLYSDHKPVYAAYRSRVEFVDEAVKLKLTREFFQDFKSKHVTSGGVPLVSFEADKEQANPVTRDEISESPSFLDDDVDYKPALPSRQPAVSKPQTPVYTEILTPKRNSPVPSPTPPVRKSTTTSNQLPPQPPRPRSTSSNISKQSSSAPSPPASTISTVSTVPVAPAPRKSTLPPGFSGAILQPKSNSSSRSSTPINTPPITAKKAPVVPKKPEALHSMHTVTPDSVVSLSTPSIPTKPNALTASVAVSHQISETKENNASFSAPAPPPPRNMNSWAPLVPK